MQKLPSATDLVPWQRPSIQGPVGSTTVALKGPEALAWSSNHIVSLQVLELKLGCLPHFGKQTQKPVDYHIHQLLL